MDTATTPQRAVTGTSDHYRVAAALAAHVGTLQAENCALRGDNARLKHAVEELTSENNDLSTGFSILLDELEKETHHG